MGLNEGMSESGSDSERLSRSRSEWMSLHVSVSESVTE